MTFTLGTLRDLLPTTSRVSSDPRVPAFGEWPAPDAGNPLEQDAEGWPIERVPQADDVVLVMPKRAVRRKMWPPRLGERRKQSILLLIGVALMSLSAVGGFALWLSGGWSEPRQQEQFAKYRSTAPLLADGTISGTWPKGVPVALLRIPKYDRSMAVGADVSRSALRNGPGFASETAFPGLVGNTVIVGKSATFGAPFSRLEGLVAGDQLILTSPVGTFGYRVTDVRSVSVGDPAILEASTTRRLTLLTHKGSPLSWKQTLVRAEQIAGEPSSSLVPPEVPLGRQDGTAPLLCLALLVAIAAIAVGSRVVLSRVLGARAVLFLAGPLLLALAIPLLLQVLLLFPRGY